MSTLDNIVLTHAANFRPLGQCTFTLADVSLSRKQTSLCTVTDSFSTSSVCMCTNSKWWALPKHFFLSSKQILFSCVDTV